MNTTTPSANTRAVGRGASFLSGGSLLFSSPAEKALAGLLDQGLIDVESGLERELKFSEDIADAVSWMVKLPESTWVEELIIRPTDRNW